MTETRGNRTTIVGTRLAPRRHAPAVNPRSSFINPDTVLTRDWRDSAKCLDSDYDAELWFSQTARDQKRATAVCFNSCPVRERCFAWAVESRQSWGIWGGIDFTTAVKPWHARRLRKAEAEAEAEAAVDEES